jgi:isocitrate dehydrogenase
MQCLKLISRPGCERIVRYAFEYARRTGRKKVTCFTKDNIMKATDGLFHQVFDEVAAEYPEIENEHWIVDIGAAKLADSPENFDVIVLPNLYGDILSDVAAQIAGSVGLAGSSNIGDEVAMFEAIHGSAPRRAGQNLANPSGLLLGAVMMLVHIGQGDIAARVHNGWLAALESGAATYDIAQPGQKSLSTTEFTQAVIDHLGQRPRKLAPVDYPVTDPEAAITLKSRVKEEKTCDGVDVFIHADSIRPDDLAAQIKAVTDNSWLQLKMITNRGVKVWPQGLPETFCVDHWRARFHAPEPGQASSADVVNLLGRLSGAGVDFVKTEGLYRFDGEPGYSLGQGQ